MLGLPCSYFALVIGGRAGVMQIAFGDCQQDKLRLSVPTIQAPNDGYFPPPTSLSVDFVEATPEEFLEIADPRNVNWELFVARRLAAQYTPSFPHLQRVNRWRSLLPPNFTESDIALVYRHDPTEVRLLDVQVTFPDTAQMSKEDLLTLVNGKLHSAHSFVVARMRAGYAGIHAAVLGSTVPPANSYPAALQ